MKVRKAQCKACPWKVYTSPREDIPTYDEKKHRDLKKTIAEPADLSCLARGENDRA